MNVRIGPGEAHVQGFQYINDANVDVSIGANSSGSTRIDVVVLRLNRSLNTLVLGVVAGTPGAGAPALTQVAGGNWEFPIANITVANGAASITGGNIADVRVYSRWPATALDATMATDAEVTSAVAAEATARGSADTTLQTNINNEAATRASADTTLSGRVTTLEGFGKVRGRAYVEGSAGSFFSNAGFASVTRLSAGMYRLVLATAAPDTNNIPLVTMLNNIPPFHRHIYAKTESTTDTLVVITDASGVGVDWHFYIAVIGG
jgi:hypothetical protein